jgi:hypothetical protein
LNRQRLAVAEAVQIRAVSFSRQAGLLRQVDQLRELSLSLMKAKRESDEKKKNAEKPECSKLMFVRAI